MSQSFQYLDSPNTTSAVTYKFQLEGSGAGIVTRINHAEADAATGSYNRVTSYITLMEVSA